MRWFRYIRIYHHFLCHLFACMMNGTLYGLRSYCLHTATIRRFTPTYLCFFFTSGEINVPNSNVWMGGVAVGERLPLLRKEYSVSLKMYILMHKLHNFTRSFVCLQKLSFTSWEKRRSRVSDKTVLTRLCGLRGRE